MNWPCRETPSKPPLLKVRCPGEMHASSYPSIQALLLASLLLSALLKPATGHAQNLHLALQDTLGAAVRSAESVESPYLEESWLQDMSGRLERFVPDSQERLMLLRKVHREAMLADLEPELVLAVIEVESGFNRFAISSAGARGLMQIMPFWLNEIGTPDDNLFHMATNLRFGCTILRHYLDMERGNMPRALARYNGSRGQTWYPDRVYLALESRWYAQ